MAKKSQGNKNVQETVGKALKESQHILAGGTNVQQEVEEKDKSPEKQAISTMGSKTVEGLSSAIHTGKDLVKNLQKQKEEKSVAADTKAQPIQNGAPQLPPWPKPETPFEPVSPASIRKPPDSNEEVNLNLLENQNVPQIHQEAGLLQGRESLQKRPEEISLRGTMGSTKSIQGMQRTEVRQNTEPMQNTRTVQNIPEVRLDDRDIAELRHPVQFIPPRQKFPEDDNALHELEDSGLLVHQNSPPNVLEGTTELPSENHTGDIMERREDALPNSQIPKTGTDPAFEMPAEPLKKSIPENMVSGTERKEPTGQFRSRSPQEEKGNKRTALQGQTEKGNEFSRLSVKTRNVDERTINVGEVEPLQTSERDFATYRIQNQGASVSTAASNGGEALKAMGQGAGEAAGQAGTTAATGAASGGVSVAVQAGEKIVEKIKETIESAAQTVKESPKTIGGIVALFFVPIIAVVVVVSSFGGNSAVTNRNLSEGVLALMPKIINACQEHGIPEYVPLVAAVMMQESGGNVELVNGDVMMCAEAMGYPVFTPVPVDESIRYGTGLIAQLLQQAEAQGPDDMLAIMLALQSYNFGPGYLTWAKENYGGYSKENAAIFSEQQAAANGWSGYGDIEYVEHVLRYYQVSSFGTGMGDPSTMFPTLSYPMEESYLWDTYGGHEGIDMGCEVGTPVYASGDGTVWYAYGSWTPADGISDMMSYGNGVCISHEDGLETRYGHMSSIVVASGQQIMQGQLIGYSGDTGNSTGPHMHFSIYVNGSYGGSGYENYAALAFGKYFEG